MKSMDERSHTFVVRLWEERREAGSTEPEWRGSVEDVRSRARFYFANLVQLCEYLSNQSGMSDSEQPRNHRKQASE